MSTTMPIHQQAIRHPTPSMRLWTHGRKTMEPTPTPEKATLIASPRRRSNQFGR